MPHGGRLGHATYVVDTLTMARMQRCGVALARIRTSVRFVGDSPHGIHRLTGFALGTGWGVRLGGVVARLGLSLRRSSGEASLIPLVCSSLGFCHPCRAKYGYPT